jgi:hypothetical protein
MIVIAEIDEKLASPVPEGAAQIGEIAGVIVSAELADWQALRQKPLDDGGGVVGRSIVRNHDLVGEGEGPGSKPLERLFQETRPVVGGDADTELDIAHEHFHDFELMMAKNSIRCNLMFVLGRSAA